MAVRAEPIYPVPWHRGRFVSWLVTTDHKRIGLLYIWTSLVFFLLGGVMALLIRTELLTPETADFVSRQTFNQLFTMHGLTMVFLVIVPILAGFGNYLLPLMIGARDMVFPRLNAFSYWTFLLGGIVLYSSWFSAGGAADTGWYLYPPYATRTGTSVDLTILALHLLAVSSLAGAINFVATVHTMRTAGMSWMRMPLFVWTIYTYAWLLIIALPAVAAALTMLLLDRTAGTHFFLPDEGGSAVLYQHMFWFFGHPEVYIMVLPAFGIVSEVIPVFARKPIFGYAAIAFSTVGIAFVSMLVWAHHMFAVGMPNFLNGFFMIASVLVGVPTGIKIINWLATLWRGNITFATPMLFALGLISVFTIGGLTGIMVAAFPFDWQVHDTYFVVAHMHYVLFGGSIFGIFAGPLLLVAEDVRAHARRGPRQAQLLALLHRDQPDLRPAALPRAARHAPARVGLPRRAVVGDVEHRLDDRLVHARARHARLPHQRLALAEVAARRERPVARRYARVVHDLAAARAQLRQGAVHLEPASFARPSPAAAGGDQVTPGPWLRLCGLGATAAAAATVASGSLGIAHRALAAIALPPLVAIVIAAWRAHPRLLPWAVASLVSFLRCDRDLVGRPGARGRSSSRARGDRRVHRAALPWRARSRRVVARLRDADEAPHHVAAAL